ncbi:MAG: alpha/beta hydrolase [Deltaproteobacteria bacterium]|nr:alpha/beta hydrolase [Kofleriaceae bacterium]
MVRGAATPTIVFEGGAGEWSTHWGDLPAQAATLGRTVVYDRAGLGWSDLAPRPRTCDVLARDLEALLRRLDVDGPLVLVAHSFGALVVRAFAAATSRPLAGVVLVDGYPETLPARLRATGIPDPEPSPYLLRVWALAARVGLLRVLDLAAAVGAWIDRRRGRTAPVAPHPLPPAALATLEAMSTDPRVLEGLARELADGTASDRIAARLPRRLAAPLRVLTSTAPIGPDDWVAPGVDRAAYNRIWVEAQADLVALASDVQQLLVTDSDHAVQLHRPDLVLGAIEQLEAEGLVS